MNRESRAQAPAANHKGTQQALEQTFTLTNISPQVGKGFNRCCPAHPPLKSMLLACCNQSCISTQAVPDCLTTAAGHQDVSCMCKSILFATHHCASALQVYCANPACRDYWARFEHFVKGLTRTCNEVGSHPLQLWQASHARG